MIAMAIADPFESRLVKAWPLSGWHDVTVLVAVSGGPDSVALLRGLIAAQSGGSCRLVAAHFNHRMRGEQADQDESFVLTLSRQFGVPCVVGRREGALTSHGQGLELAMRRARYGFLLRAAENSGARYIATAHTADDQAETILHRIIRGTGLLGLAGIPKLRTLSPAVSLVRPMLAIRRTEVRDYLARLGQPAREDATNQDLSLRRNRIRHQLLPQLAAHYNKEVVDALLRLGQLAFEAQQVLQRQVEQLVEACVIWEGSDGARVVCAQLAEQPRHLVRELVRAIWRQRGWPQRAMGYDQWAAACSLIEQSAAHPVSQALTLPGRILARAEQGQVLLIRQR
jgi:tRNA(Ile)-lysidine synthase